MTPDTLQRNLTALGLIPFVAGFAAQVAEVSLFGFSAIVLFATYSTVILSFLAGTVWGSARVLQADHQFTLFLISNLVVIVSWLLLLNQFLNVLLIVNALLFIAIIRCEAGLKLSDSYRRLRFSATAVVVSLHIGMVILL